MAAPCSVPPEVLVPATNQTLELALGTRVALNCTVRWAGTGQCQHSPAWSKDGQWLSSGSSQDMAWFAPNASGQLLSSVLQLNLTHDSDFGVFTCWVSNATATFTLRRAEPSAELVMTMSRCRRLIVVLSLAYLEQDWCNHSFREGLWRLLELTSRPIFIVFDGRYREIQHPAINLLRQHRGTVTLLLWREGSMTPSSDFWKELCLALPRRVSLPGPVGDPQTRLQGDKDPMLTLSSTYGDSGSDLHPDGDLALQDCMFRPPPPRLAPAAAAGMEQPQLRDAQGPEIQDSDLGSRNYSVRSDFYCLVMGDV